MYSWSEQAMTTRLNWEKRNVDANSRLSITDEDEFRQNDLAARWIERDETGRSNSNWTTFCRDGRKKPKRHNTLPPSHNSTVIIPTTSDLPGLGWFLNP